MEGTQDGCNIHYCNKRINLYCQGIIVALDDMLLNDYV